MAGIRSIDGENIFTFQNGRRLFSYELNRAFKHFNNESLLSMLTDCELSEVKDESGKTLLHLAAFHDRSYLVKHLIQAGCNVDAQDCNGETPLFYAIRVRSGKAILTLCEARARVCMPKQNDPAPLRMLASQLLMSDMEEAEVDRNVVITVLKSLGSSGASVEFIKQQLIDCYLSLPHAVYLKNIEVVKAFVESGCDVNETDLNCRSTALHNAVLIGDFEQVKYLIKCGADVNAKNLYWQMPIALVNFNQFPNILRLLLEEGTNIYECNRQGRMQLRNALMNGVKETINIILEYKPNLKQKDINDETMIHYVACNHNDGVPELFLSQIFDPTMKDEEFINTLLHSALEGANLKVVRMLIEMGADVNREYPRSRAPLYVALESNTNLVNRRRCVELLFACGAEENHMNSLYLYIAKYFLSNNRQSELIDYIIMHLAYVQALGQSVREIIIYMIDDCERKKSFFNKVKKELQAMKTPVIGGSVTYFEILVEPVDKIVKSARNTKLRVTFEKNIKRMFPINESILDQKFKRAFKLSRTVDAVENAFRDNFRINKLYARNLVSMLISKKLSSTTD